MDNSVAALAVSGSKLYAGGTFSTAGGVSASRIAQWNGSAWSALGTGVSNNVQALAVIGTDLYAGGLFSTAGGVTANRIAKWDGAAWSAMGLFAATGGINTLAVSGTTLYAGGYFFSTGPQNNPESVINVAKWDGSKWSYLGSGTGSSNAVQTLVASGTDLYAAGLSAAGSGAPPKVSKWNGTSWSAVGTQTTWYGALAIYALAVNGTDLFVGGSVQGLGDPFNSNIAKWDGSALSQLYQGINGKVGTLAVSGSYLYAGGAFTAADGVVVNGIARWDGATWTALGSGVNGSVAAILVNGADVYVGGSFTTAGGVAANRIAKWDGTAWSALGQGMSGTGSVSVSALAMIGTDLYAGGSFSTADGVTANGIARWDGSAWSALATGLGAGSVNALAVAGTDLYVGGAFSTAGGEAVSRIAKWNGSTWSALGSGYPGIVFSLAVSGTRVYAGGSSNLIFVWDGRSFFPYLSAPFSPVYTLLVSGTNLYAGGTYSSTMGYISSGIAKWDGNSWSALGSGIEVSLYQSPLPSVNALAIDAGNHLFIGGTGFTTVGRDVVSPNLAQANLPTPTPDIAVTQSSALSDGTGSVDFGPVVAGSGSAARTFTITNPGDADLSGLSISVDGANLADFMVSTLASTRFGPGGTLTFTVTYTPSAAAAGSAALHISSNVSGSKNPFDIALTGIGVTANQGWLQQYFGSTTGVGNAAPGADPNRNGIPNLIEYALGGDPTGNATGTSVLPAATVNAGGNCLQLNFKRWLDRNDVTLTVQAADDPAGPWTDLAQSANGGAFSVITPGASIAEVAIGNPRAVSVTDLFQISDPARPCRFMRLRVSQ